MRPPAVDGGLGISGCGGELALAALCGDCDAPPRVWVGWRGCDLFLHPLRPCRNQRQLSIQPAAAFSGGRHGRGGRGLIFLLRLRAGGGLASSRGGGAGSTRTADGFDGPSNSAIRVSSAGWRWRPRRVNTASPPSNASNTQVISHPNPRPSLPGSARARRGGAYIQG